MSRTLWTVLEATSAKYPALPALKQPLGGGEYRTWTWREYAETVRFLAVDLREIGVAPGDIVALQSETRAEFCLADFGVMTAGAVAAALYTSLPYADQARTLRACDARVVFVENEKEKKALEAASSGELNVRWIQLTGDSDGLTLEKLRTIGSERLQSDPQAFQKICAQFDDTALAILYMTSGATGEPKMGVATHRSIVANIDMGPLVLPLSPADSTIAFLPSAHIAQRVVVQILPVLDGVCVWFSEGLQKLPHELKSIRPTFFLAPPRVWERVFASISTEIKKRPAVVRKLFYMGSAWAQKPPD